MKLKSIILLVGTLVFTMGVSSCEAQIPNASIVEVKVWGNCGMCKRTIENAGNKRKKAQVDWNSETKMATIIYNEKKTTADKVLKRIANAGYDNEEYYAPNAVYEELHGCCKYDRKPKNND